MLGSTDIVAFVSITNGDRARAFYEGVLGLKFVKDDGFALGREYVVGVRARLVI